jgi:hypothetical protein
MMEAASTSEMLVNFYFCNSYRTVSKNHCLTTLYVLFVCGCGHPYLSASITLVWLFLDFSIHLCTLHCGKQFCPYLEASYQWISAPFISSDTNKRTIASCLSLVQTSSGAVIFTSWSLGTVGLQLNHICNMSPSDLEQQYYQASAVLLVIQ